MLVSLYRALDNPSTARRPGRRQPLDASHVLVQALWRPRCGSTGVSRRAGTRSTANVADADDRRVLISRLTMGRGWMRTRHFSFGVVVYDHVLPDELQTMLERWVDGSRPTTSLIHRFPRVHRLPEGQRFRTCTAIRSRIHREDLETRGSRTDARTARVPRPCSRPGYPAGRTG